MFWESVLLAQREIRRNALRSSLTILGIAIGVAAVITMVTLGGGVTAQVTSDISKLGSNLLMVRPGQRFHGSGGVRSSAPDFDMEDVRAIAKEIPGVEAAAPSASSPPQSIYGNLNWSTTVSGGNNDYLKVRDWRLESGRKFTVSQPNRFRLPAL